MRKKATKQVTGRRRIRRQHESATHSRALIISNLCRFVCLFVVRFWKVKSG